MPLREGGESWVSSHGGAGCREGTGVAWGDAASPTHLASPAQR